MMITEPKIEKYLMQLARETDPLLIEMERLARATDFPIVDRLVGRLLYVITKIKKPRLIVELGSGFGYSAYWFAQALDKGKVILTDTDEGNIRYARRMFKKAGLQGKARFVSGDAVQAARRYRDIDILFIDIEKHQYLDAVKTLEAHLNKNGLIIADNSLWYGKVAEGKRDRETRGIRDFNHYLSTHKDFFTTIVPLRDGVLIASKVS